MTRPIVDRHAYQRDCECNACLALQLRRQNALYGYRPAMRWRGVIAAAWLTIVTAAIVALVLLAAGVITWNPRS